MLKYSKEEKKGCKSGTGFQGGGFGGGGFVKNGFSEKVLLLEYLWHLGKGIIHSLINTVTARGAIGVNQGSLKPLALLTFLTSAERQACGF